MNFILKKWPLRLDRFAFLWRHPWLWLLVYGAISYQQIVKIRYIGFNLIEALLGKSLFNGWGYVFAPLDPPALSRPMFAPFLCAIIERFVTHPVDVYRTLHVVALSSFLASIFYLFKTIAGSKAGNLAALLLLTTPLFTKFPWATHHYASHLGLLSVLGWAILATVVAWRGSSFGRFAVAGVLWGCAFLARYEMILSFAVCWCVTGLYVWGKMPRLRAVKCLGVFAFVFLLFYLPKDVYYHQAAKAYDIVADNAIYTYYTGEVHSKSGGTVANGDNLGYVESQQIYGSIESNKGSLLYLIWNHPQPVWRRFVQNLVVGTSLIFRSPTYFVGGVFIFLIGLLHPRSKRYRPFAALFLALHLSGFANYLFHIDLRYLTPMCSFLFLLVALGMVSIVLDVAPAWGVKRRYSAYLLTAGVLFLSFQGTEYYSKDYLGSRQTEEGYAEIGSFLKTQKLPSPPVVWVELPEDIFLLQPFFSYFADSAIAWHFTGPFPLNKMAALTEKNIEFIVLDEAGVKRHAELVGEKSLFEVRTSSFGLLSLLKAKVQ